MYECQRYFVLVVGLNWVPLGVELESPLCWPSQPQSSSTQKASRVSQLPWILIPDQHKAVTSTCTFKNICKQRFLAIDIGTIYITHRPAFRSVMCALLIVSFMQFKLVISIWLMQETASKRGLLCNGMGLSHNATHKLQIYITYILKR